MKKEVITVSTSESRPRPEPVSDEAQRFQDAAQIPSLLMVGGPIVAAAAVTVVVVLAALTSWWLLFALFALPPLMMMVGGPAMMATGGSFARFCAQMPCASWFRNDMGRATPHRWRRSQINLEAARHLSRAASSSLKDDRAVPRDGSR